jgi:hypothetical protein
LSKSARAGNADTVSPKGVVPLHPAQVPFGQRHRFRLDYEVNLEAWVFAANLRVLAIEDDPEPSAPEGLITELESHHHAVVGESVTLEVPLAPGPQHDVGIDVLGRQF